MRSRSTPDVRAGDILQAQLSARTSLTESLVKVEHVVRLDDDVRTIGPEITGASCFRVGGRAAVMFDAGGPAWANGPLEFVELGGFTLGEHVLRVAGRSLIAFDDNVPSGRHEVSIRGRTDTTVGPATRFTCEL